MCSFYLVAAVAVHAVTLASTATAGDAPVTVKVRLDGDSYMRGEPILLLLDFQNHSDKWFMSDLELMAGNELGGFRAAPFDDLDEGMEHALQAVLKGPHGFVQTWRPRSR